MSSMRRSRGFAVALPGRSIQTRTRSPGCSRVAASASATSSSFRNTLPRSSAAAARARDARRSAAARNLSSRAPPSAASTVQSWPGILSQSVSYELLTEHPRASAATRACRGVRGATSPSGDNDWMAKTRSGFATLGLSDDVVAAVTALGYEEPTPVQQETIPVMLAGRDLLAQAATGTGKTAAFALPMLQRIVEAGAVGRHPTAGLVLVPTRELAMQVAEAIHKYARGGRVSVVPLFGGASMHQQIRALDRGANIVVATPGRALDHIRRQTLKLDLLSVLVLDEADEMLDMGFADDLDAILDATHADRQTALFSGTKHARILSI